MELQLYRSGQAATKLGVSRHIIARLADSGLIDHKRINGRLYLPGEEIARLEREGIPTLPAPVHEEEPEPPQEVADDRPAAAPRREHRQPTDEKPPGLYGAPSRKLAKSKEDLIRLQHAAEKKRLQRQMQEEEQEAWRRQKEGQEAETLRARNTRCLEYAADLLTNDCDASVRLQVHADVEHLLESLAENYSEPTIRRHIDGIAGKALEPIRRRKYRAAAINRAIEVELPYRARQDAYWCQRATEEAHKQVGQLPSDADELRVGTAARHAVSSVAIEYEHRRRIAEALSGNPLSVEATGDEREQALAAARQAFSTLPVGASSRDIETVKRRATAPYESRVEQRLAFERHRRNIDIAVLLLPLPIGATKDEQRTAARHLRQALEALPPTVTPLEFSAAREKALAPTVASIKDRATKEASCRAEEARREREQRAAAEVKRETSEKAERQAETVLSNLRRYILEEYEYDSQWEAYRDADRIKSQVKPRMLEKILRGEFLNEASMERWLHAQVDRILEDEE